MDGALEQLESARKDFLARHRDSIVVHSLAHVCIVGRAAEEYSISGAVL